MAQKSETVRVSGRVVKLDRIAGEFTARDTGELREYDYYEARLLTPSYDISLVRFSKNGPVDLPALDTDYEFVCDARAAGQNVRLTALSATALAS